MSLPIGATERHDSVGHDFLIEFFEHLETAESQVYCAFCPALIK